MIKYVFEDAFVGAGIEAVPPDIYGGRIAPTGQKGTEKKKTRTQQRRKRVLGLKAVKVKWSTAPSGCIA